MSALVPQVAPAPQVIPVLQTAPPPQVLFLILGEEAEFNNTHETLISETTTKYTTTHKSNTDDAYNYLLTTKPSAIFVDGGIVFKQNRHLQQLLARYASSGGTIVLSSLFYSNSTEDMMINLVDLFGRFGLCWELGSGHRGAYKLNEVVKPTFGSDNFATLEKRYSMRCIQLLDTPIFSRVYTPAARPAISDLFSPYETGPSPAIFARYGQGFFGFIGDLQNQKGSQSLTLAMIGTSLFLVSHTVR